MGHHEESCTVGVPGCARCRVAALRVNECGWARCQPGPLSNFPDTRDAMFAVQQMAGGYAVVLSAKAVECFPDGMKPVPVPPPPDAKGVDEETLPTFWGMPDETDWGAVLQSLVDSCYWYEWQPKEAMRGGWFYFHKSDGAAANG